MQPPVHDNCVCTIVDGMWLLGVSRSGPCPTCIDLAAENNYPLGIALTVATGAAAVGLALPEGGQVGVVPGKTVFAVPEAVAKAPQAARALWTEYVAGIAKDELSLMDANALWLLFLAALDEDRKKKKAKVA